MTRKRKKYTKRQSQRVFQRNLKTDRLLREKYKINIDELSIIDDKRYYTPQPDVRKLTNGVPVSYTLSKKKTKTVLRDPTRAKIAFQSPIKTIVCLRRKTRRIALFASGGIGKGRVVSRIRRRVMESNIKC